MKPLRLLIAAVALALLGGGIWYSNEHPPKPETAPDAKPATKVVSVKDAEISRVHIVKVDGAATTLEKDGRGQWNITEPKKLPADDSGVKSLLTAISGLEAETVISEKGGDVASFGLDNPKLKVQAVAGSKTIEISIGNEAPTGSPVYARISGDDRIFGLSPSVKGSLDKVSADLRDKRVLRADPDKVSKVTLDNKTNTGASALEFGRAGTEWQIVKPRAMRADTYSVDDLIRAGSSAFDSIVVEDETDKDQQKEVKKHDFSKPFAVLTLVDPVGEHRMTVIEEKAPAPKDPKQTAKDKSAKDKNATPEAPAMYFAKTSDVPGIYKLSSTASSSLGKALAGFRNNLLFDSSFSDPDKIEVRDGSLKLTIDKKTDKKKNEDQWFIGSKQVSGEKVQTLLSAIRRLSASAYPSEVASEQAKYGLDKPTLEVKLTTAGKPQHVVFSVNGDNAYAARDSDPATYQIAATDAGEMKKAINDLK